MIIALLPLLALAAAPPAEMKLATSDSGSLIIPTRSNPIEVPPEEGLERAAEAIGTCGPVIVAEGGNSVQCDGWTLSLDENRFSVRPHSGKPQTICNAYVAESPTVNRWTLKPGQRLCLGETVLTQRSTLDEVKRQMTTAYEVIREGNLQRLHSNHLNLIFSNNLLQSAEIDADAEVAALVAAGRSTACAAKRSEACRLLTSFAEGSAPPLSPVFTLGYTVTVADGRRSEAATVLSISVAHHAREFETRPANESERMSLQSVSNEAAAGGNNGLSSSVFRLMRLADKKRAPTATVRARGRSLFYQHQALGARWLRRNGASLYMIGRGRGLESPSLFVVEMPDGRR